MNSISCEECRAIYRELRDTSAAASHDQPQEETSPQKLAAYLDQLNEDDCARMGSNVRLVEDLAKTGRAPDSHRTLAIVATIAAGSDAQCKLTAN